MPQLLHRTKGNRPTGGRRGKWVAFGHGLLNILLPFSLWLLVENNLYELAFILVICSKWRIFAVRPRHWATNLRANGVDLIVKLGTLTFIVLQTYWVARLVWTLWYVFWLMVAKPGSSSRWVGFQSIAAQFLGVAALSQVADRYEVALVVGCWLIGYSAARHFMSSYEEPLSIPFAHFWAIFCAQLAWVLHHWLLQYVFISQLTIVTTFLAYSVASTYHLYQEGKLKPGVMKQHLAVACVILLVIIGFADWRGGI